MRVNPEENQTTCMPVGVNCANGTACLTSNPECEEGIELEENDELVDGGECECADCEGRCIDEPYGPSDEEGEEETIMAHNLIDNGGTGIEIAEEEDVELGDETPVAYTEEKKCGCGEKRKIRGVGIVNGEIDLVEPDNRAKEPWLINKLLKKHKLLQLVATTDVKINFPGYKEIVIPAGTRGGLVSSEVKLVSSWLDSDSFVTYGTVSDSLIIRGHFTEIVGIQDSYLSISNSILKGCTLRKRVEISNSTLRDATIDDSTVRDCRRLTAFHAVRSFVGGLRDLADLRIFDGEITKNCDFIQVLNVGHSNRTVCAYLSARGGVRVTTGCFNGTLEELKIANAQTHLGYHYNNEGYLVSSTKKHSSYGEWAYKEYDMLIKYIEHHFKLDINTQTVNTTY